MGCKSCLSSFMRIHLYYSYKGILLMNLLIISFYTLKKETFVSLHEI